MKCNLIIHSQGSTSHEKVKLFMHLKNPCGVAHSVFSIKEMNSAMVKFQKLN